MRICTPLFLFLFSWATSFSQPRSIRNLIFEGAGIRGIAYSGAIAELQIQGLLDSVRRVGGTSSGAITAMLLSIGYTAEEITSIVNSTSFKKFNDGRFFFAGGINRFRRFFGWYRGRAMEKWLGKILKDKTGDGDVSFDKLHRLGCKDLYVTGTSLTEQKLIVFSRESYPDMKVRDAVRISMSIPLYFEAVFLDSSGAVIRHPKDLHGLRVMTDGGFTGNFPIHIFDSSRFLDSNAPNIFIKNPETIGFRIDSDDQIKNDRSNGELAERQINNLGDYFAAFYTIIIENLNRQSLTPADWQRTVSISDGAIAPRIRKLSAAELNTLTSNGAQALRTFLKK